MPLDDSADTRAETVTATGGSDTAGVEAGSGSCSLSGHAVTLHLYIPPFRRCRAWTRPEDASHVLKPVMTYYSEFGEVVEVV